MKVWTTTAQRWLTTLRNQAFQASFQEATHHLRLGIRSGRGCRPKRYAARLHSAHRAVQIRLIRDARSHLVNHFPQPINFANFDHLQRRHIIECGIPSVKPCWYRLRLDNL